MMHLKPYHKLGRREGDEAVISKGFCHSSNASSAHGWTPEVDALSAVAFEEW